MQEEITPLEKLDYASAPKKSKSRSRLLRKGLAALLVLTGVAGTNLSLVDGCTGNRGITKVSKYIPMWDVNISRAGISLTSIVYNEVYSLNIWGSGNNMRGYINKGKIKRENNSFSVDY